MTTPPTRARRAASRRARAAARLRARDEVRSVDRPLPGGRTLPLAYTRTGPRSVGRQVPVLVFPGGPGLASVRPYAALRAQATKAGLDLVMVEHRGVGLSRQDAAGADLLADDMTSALAADDAAAVLDAEGIEKAVVYGTSYGSYLAQVFGARHPDRVAAMILDSAMVGADNNHAARAALNDTLWVGGPQTDRVAAAVRRLVEAGRLDPRSAFGLQLFHEFTGPEDLRRMLALLERGRGRRTWRWVHRLGAREVTKNMPLLMEFDLVDRIAFRELDYAATAPMAEVSGPLRVEGSFEALARRYEPFDPAAPEALDTRAVLPGFDWPVVVISGDRDLRTPRRVSEEIVGLAPRGRLVAVRANGHSALDTQRALAVDIARRVREHSAGAELSLPADPSGRPTPLARLLRAQLTLSERVRWPARLLGRHRWGV